MVRLLLLAPAGQVKTEWPKTSPPHFQHSPGFSLSLTSAAAFFRVCVCGVFFLLTVSLFSQYPLALCVRFVRFCGFCEPFLCVLMGLWAILVHFYGFCVAFCLTFFFCILKCTCMSCCVFYAVVCAFFVRLCIFLCVLVYVCICLCVCFCIITCIRRPVHIHVTEDTLVPFNFLSEASSWPN